MAGTDLTAQKVRELLEYNPDTGVFKWRRTAKGRRLDLSPGTVNDSGYLMITIGWRRWRAHRLAWLYMHSVWPSNQIDHINGNRLDNRLCNLREVDYVLNGQNKKKGTARNKSGFLGVDFRPQFVERKWRATIFYNGKQKHIGMYQTPEEASRAYLEAKRKLHAGYVP